MDETTKINVEEQLGLALGHLHKANDLVPELNSDLGLDIAVCYAKTELVLNRLREEVPTG